PPLPTHAPPRARPEPVAGEERAIVIAGQEARLLAFRALRDRKTGARRLRTRRILVLLAEREPDALEMLRIESREHVRLVLGIVGPAMQEHASAMLGDPCVVAGSEPVAACASREGEQLRETKASIAAD